MEAELTADAILRELDELDDTDEISLDRDCLSEEEENAKKEVFQRLAAPGVKSLVIEYEGDSDEDTFVSEDAEGNEVNLPSETVSLVEEFVGDTLPWGVSEGSYGTVTFDVVANRVQYAHTFRVEFHEKWEA